MKDGDRLLNLVAKVYQESIKEQRYHKCINRFKSTAICSNNVPFFLWAQYLYRNMAS